jgi:TolB-like protein
MPDEQLLSELADAIIDGKTVDWAAAESNAGDDRELVAHLRVVAELARVHTLVGEQWGHLRILEQIGRGAFGDVFRAWDTRLDREVALKLLPADPRRGRSPANAIIDEGRLLARVRHPNVVTIYGAEQIGSEIGLWMEFVHGRTLEQRLRETATFSAAETVEIGLQLCQAVSAVHGAGLVHRDIKAQNVMVADDSRVVLMDFGAGREFDDEPGRVVTGTPLYLAPEVLQGGVATVRSDVYSLGVLLYHLVTGSYPVHGSTLNALRSAHERNVHTSVKVARPDLPTRLARVIERAINPDPERRYANAKALATDLTALRPRSALVRVARVLAVAAAFVCIVGIVWEVRARRTGATTRPSAMLTRLAGLAPGVALEPQMMAVLPFQNLSREPGGDELADGLTVGLMQQLAMIDGLRVTAPFSSFIFRDTPRNLQDIAQQLGATLFIEGQTRLDGDMLHVTAQLTRAPNIPVWSEGFDRRMTSSTEVAVIQEEMAREIVNRLRLKLGRGQRHYALPFPLYVKYVRAERLLARRGRASAEAAIQFEEITALHPDHAPSWAGLASALAEVLRNANPDSGLPSDHDLARVREAANRAIVLDSVLPEAHAALGFVDTYDRKWTRAESAFERALELNPSRTITHTDFVLSTLIPLGKLEAALRYLADAQTVDPLSLDVRRVIGIVQLNSGRYAEAIESFTWVRERNPEFPFTENHLGLALAVSGRPDEALRIFQKPSQAANWGLLGFVYGVLGRRADAEELLAKSPNRPARQMQVYAGLGDKDRAFEALERLSDLNWWLAAFHMQRPEMALLRGDPRLNDLRRKLGLPAM